MLLCNVVCYLYRKQKDLIRDDFYDELKAIMCNVAKYVAMVRRCEFL